MSKILFAITHVLTSQGWFQPTALLPQLDLPLEEVEKLVLEAKAALAEHDSPLAARVHELARNCIDKLLASEYLKHAVRDLSAVNIDTPVEMPSEPFVDPTAPGEFPTLETYLKVGYKEENYEGQKASFYADKQRMADEAAQREAAAKKQSEQDELDKAAVAEAAKKAATPSETDTVSTETKTPNVENPGSQEPPATESTTV